jgi:hypothetical protein
MQEPKARNNRNSRGTTEEQSRLSRHHDAIPSPPPPSRRAGEPVRRWEKRQRETSTARGADKNHTRLSRGQRAIPTASPRCRQPSPGGRASSRALISTDPAEDRARENIRPDEALSALPCQQTRSCYLAAFLSPRNRPHTTCRLSGCQPFHRKASDVCEPAPLINNQLQLGVWRAERRWNRFSRFSFPRARAHSRG